MAPARQPSGGQVEPAHPAHATVLAAMSDEAFPPGQRWTAAAIEQQLGLPGVYGFLDGRGGMVLARAAGGEAEVLTLAVAPAVRRRGIARTLLQAALREAAQRGAAELFLEAAEANLAAQGLYAGLGFLQVGRRPAYYADGEAALVLRIAIQCAATSGPGLSAAEGCSSRLDPGPG